ncbi:hypothetical protein SLUN_37420 [Streptomyces lunaelactis]|uniref:F5/8 type C domain-containing protein n=2 Tax=Streptomyces lunaelactis TaxID=1535768 RepID=A0A2R4TD08_9ACTN|nr:hypothetical protein SLUN_37420 [Streptomyces lunaelactis]NUK85460.1 discoidin domain-containing protein [Streptomyces lunaelactis]
MRRTLRVRCRTVAVWGSTRPSPSIGSVMPSIRGHHRAATTSLLRAKRPTWWKSKGLILLGLASVSAALLPLTTPVGGTANAGTVSASRAAPAVGAVAVPHHHAAPAAAMEPAAPVLPREGWTATASDEETTTDNGAALGLDGDPDNLWHRTWYGTAASFPHSITIDKHRTAVVSALVYRPRTGSTNGRIGKYTVHLKPEGGDWGPALANTLLGITAVATAMSGEESAAPSASSAPAAPSAERTERLTERLIVGYKPKAPEARSDEAVGEEATTKAAQAGEKLLFDRRLGTGAALVDLGGVQPATDVAAPIRFRADPDAAYVVPGYPVQALATTAPNDTDFPRQWNLNESKAGMNVPDAWRTSAGQAVTVAVLDTGMAKHSGLDTNIVAGYDFISKTSSRRTADGRDRARDLPAAYKEVAAAGSPTPRRPCERRGKHRPPVDGSPSEPTES